jgi:hypothetical protein
VESKAKVVLKPTLLFYVLNKLSFGTTLRESSRLEILHLNKRILETVIKTNMKIKRSRIFALNSKLD